MEQKYNGSQASKDPREVRDLVPAKPVPPGFAGRTEFEGFQMAVTNAFKQRLLPESIETPEQAIVIALKGRELGLDPLYALSVIYLVHGKPSLEGEAMLGLAMRRYPDLKIEWVEQSHAKAILKMARPGGNFSTFEFTVQDALRARILERVNQDGTVSAMPNRNGKKNYVWEQYTKDMLMWRAVARAVRFLFPECIQGCLTPDELAPPEPVGIVSPKEIDSQFVDALPPAEVKRSLTAEEIVGLRPEPLEAVAPSHTEANLKRRPLLDVDPVREEPRPVQSSQDQSSPEVTPSVPEAELLPFEKPLVARDGSYLIRFGSHMGKTLNEIPKGELKLYLLQLQKQDERVKGADAQIKELISKISAFII